MCGETGSIIYVVLECIVHRIIMSTYRVEFISFIHFGALSGHNNFYSPTGIIQDWENISIAPANWNY